MSLVVNFKELRLLDVIFIWAKVVGNASNKTMQIDIEVMPTSLTDE